MKFTHFFLFTNHQRLIWLKTKSRCISLGPIIFVVFYRVGVIGIGVVKPLSLSLYPPLKKKSFWIVIPILFNYPPKTNLIRKRKGLITQGKRATVSAIKGPCLFASKLVYCQWFALSLCSIHAFCLSFCNSWPHSQNFGLFGATRPQMKR